MVGFDGWCGWVVRQGRLHIRERGNPLDGGDGGPLLSLMVEHLKVLISRAPKGDGGLNSRAC